MKGAVNLCIINQGAVTDCDSGTNGVPPSYSGPTGSNLGSVSVTNGVITATASNNNGLSGQTAVLTPTLASNGAVSWCMTGSNDAGLSSSCSGGSVDIPISCSGNTCTYNGTTYTMWPSAQSGYVIGNLANFATLMSGHSYVDYFNNSSIKTQGVGDLYVASVTSVSCSVGTCRRLTIQNSSNQLMGYIYSPGTALSTPYTWQTTVP